MLSIKSGFTPDQEERFRTMFRLLLVGIVILILGVGILCFGRMYTFDSSRYDLFTVFGIIIVAMSAIVIIVPVGCQLKIYLEVQKAKEEGTSGSEYGVPAAAAVGYAPATMGTQAYRPSTLPQMGGGPSMYHPPQYQHQQQPQPHHHQQMAFSSAAYMMSQQQQQNPMLQRMDQPRLYNESVAGEEATDTVGKQGRSQIWSSADKPQQH